MRNELISENAADKVDRPKKGRYLAGFYSKEELSALFEATKDDSMSVVIQLRSAAHTFPRFKAPKCQAQDIQAFLDRCIVLSFFSFSGTQDSRSLLCDKQSAHSNDNHRIGKSIQPSA